MSETPQSSPPLGSPSNPKPPTPPPTDDQMERVRDLASQLYHGFKKRPPVGADGRGSWEARFMRKFHAMLKILVVAKFDELPPFAIGCIWENNRRLRLGDPKFDPERIVSAKSPGHPAYRSYSKHRLRYTPAFNGSPMCLKKEREIRDNWWSNYDAPQAGSGDVPTPETVGGIHEVQDIGREGPEGPRKPSHSVANEVPRGMERGAIDEGESEVELDTEGADTGLSRGMRGRRRGGSRTTTSRSAAQHGGVTATSRPKPSRKSTRDMESEMEIDGEDTNRGRDAGKGEESQGMSTGIQGRTRSASRKRAAATSASTPAAAAAAAAAVPTTAAAAAAALEDAGPGGPSSSKSQTRSKRKDKGKERQSQKLTVYELQPEPIVSGFIAHARPCDRCRKLKIECLFNPLLRSYCKPCREQKVKCSNAFKVPTDHCMATYLGYAIFRMVSDPSTYVEPTFSPTHLPTPLPEDIDWFRILYEKARGKTKVRIPSQSAPPVASHSVVQDVSNSHPPLLPLTVPRSTLESGGSTPRKSRSRSVSYAPSGASSTMPGSSTVSAEVPPPSPSAASEASHETPAEVPSANRARPSSDHGASGGSSGAMSIDGEERAAAPPTTGTVQGDQEVQETRDQSLVEAVPPASRFLLFPPHPQAPTRERPLYILYRGLQASSWKGLPRLGPRLPDGFYSVVPPPHSEDWKERWRMLAHSGHGYIPAVPEAATSHPAEPVPPSRARTPPAQVFSISDEVLRLVHDARTKFDEIVRIKGQMQSRAKVHMNRSEAAKWRQDGDAAVDVQSVHAEDLSLLWASISEINLMLARLSEVFEIVPAVPANWTAVLELLTQVGQLRDLYKVSWERFASLEEDVRPIRAEMQRLRYRMAEVQDQLDQVSNDAVTACQPLIHNLYSQIDNRLTHLERGGPSPVPHVSQTDDVLKILSRLSERVEQLERAAEADDFRTRIDGYISRYMTDRGVTDHSLRQLGFVSTDTLSSGSAGSSVSHVLHTVYPGPPSGSIVAPEITGGVPAIPPNPFPSAAAPGTAQPMPVAANTPQHEPPADVVVSGSGARSNVERPGPSMISRMHKKAYGRGSSSARHGG